MPVTTRTRRGLAGAAAAAAALGVAQPAMASSPGAVYALSNEAQNAVITFDRAADGSLHQRGATLTGGTGSGAGLGTQSALARSKGFLLAVNAASNDVSVFRTGRHGLRLVDVESSGGTQPVSVSIRGRLVYVLNAGNGGNVSGFRLSEHGKLKPIAGSTQPLPSVNAGPAQVAITPDGDGLVVTEKATSTIDTFPLRHGARAGVGTAHPSSGITPFGFAFGPRDTLIVSEAAGGAALASSASSYDLRHGRFTTVSASVPTLQTAACWLVTTGNGRYAFTTNAGSDSVSTFAVSRAGVLSLLHSDSAGAGAHPTDAALSRGDRFLYTLDAFTHQVTGFEVASDGTLTPLGATGTLPASASGLVAR
jgi:6-phosphogluconolactonase (cycloisomerase 2 family)